MVKRKMSHVHSRRTLTQPAGFQVGVTMNHLKAWSQTTDPADDGERPAIRGSKPGVASFNRSVCQVLTLARSETAGHGANLPIAAAIDPWNACRDQSANFTMAGLERPSASETVEVRGPSSHGQRLGAER